MKRGATVVDMDGSPHTMNSKATIAASPKILADLVELIAEAQKVARLNRALPNSSCMDQERPELAAPHAARAA